MGPSRWGSPGRRNDPPQAWHHPDSGAPLHCPVPAPDLCGSWRGQEWRTRGQRDNAWLSHPPATLRFGRVLSGCFRRTANLARPAGCQPTGLLFLEDVETAVRPDARPGWRISELSPDPHLGKSLAPRPGSPGLNWAVRRPAAERVPTTTQHGLPEVPAAQGTSARDVIRKASPVSICPAATAGCLRPHGFPSPVGLGGQSSRWGRLGALGREPTSALGLQTTCSPPVPSLKKRREVR